MALKGFLQKYFRHALLFLLIAGVIPLTTQLSLMQATYFPTNLDRPMGIQIFSEMIGGVRTVLASLIAVKADLYHHEREGKTYWREDPTTLPLHRMVTALDPQNEKAYDFGAYHLAINFRKPEEAIKFLQEGLHYNPRSYLLHQTMGEIYYFRGDYEGAIRYFLRALSLAVEPIDIKNSLRRLYISNRRLKRYNEATRFLTMWYHLDPRDPLPRKFQKELEMLRAGKITEEELTKIIRDDERIRMEKEASKQIHKETHDCGSHGEDCGQDHQHAGNKQNNEKQEHEINYDYEHDHEH